MIPTTIFKNAAASALVFAAAAVCAQAYPNKPVTLVVPFPSGGFVDGSGRLVSESLGKLLGQSVVVDNRPGAAGNIGYSYVARAPKDGYTLLVAYSSTHACNPALFSNLTWDPNKDFAPIGMVTVAPMLMAINASVPVNTLQEFIAYLKANPGKVNYGSSGSGSLAHIAGEMFQSRTGTKITHVPYKGTGPLLTDLIGGQIQFAFASPPALMPHVRSGKLKALGITSLKPDSTLPDVRTAHESGMPGFEVEGWVGLFAPAGTPAPVLDKLADATRRMIEQPDFQQRASAGGYEIRYVGAAALASKVKAEVESCAATVRSAHIKLD